MAARPPARKPAAAKAKATAPAARSRTRKPPPLAATDVERLPDDRRSLFLDAIRANKTTSNLAALRAAGITGFKRDLKKLLDDDDLLSDARDARGWNIVEVEDTIWQVAKDPTHQHWERASGRLVRAYGGPQFREDARVELTGDGGGPIQFEDRSASLADVARVLEAAGALAQLVGGTAQRALPAAADVLPDPAEG